ncbi:MAG: PKD domain-containing protein, partial [Planctomycetota bacterium]
MIRQTNLKSVIAAVFTVLVVYGQVWAFSGAGSGTEADPYVITDVYELQEMNDVLDAFYVLGNDIDASETSVWHGGEGFVPVGIFTGTFDGNRYSINNLHINRLDSSDQGLFSTLSGAIVKDVDLVNANVTFYSSGGILAGNVDSDSVITFCSATGIVTLKVGSDEGRGGGLFGNVTTGSEVEQCFADVDVNADNRKQVGGLVGYLLGQGYDTLLSNSYSCGTVTGSGSQQGNLVGDVNDSDVDRCYSCGYEKALIGFSSPNSVITNCYWDMDKGASSSSYGGTPKTTAKMMQEATFVDWDFVDIWGIVENESYPFLRAFITPLEVAFDIKPGSCPNPLNIRSQGVLPVAILGWEDFDVNTIDLTSIRLGEVAAVRHSYEDVGAPVLDGNECECDTTEPDGYLDLTLKFKTQDVVEDLINTVDELFKGQILSLTVTGVLSDEMPIIGTDCIVLVGNVSKWLLDRGWAAEGRVSNHPPTADAGTNQTVTDTDENGSEEVTLNASGSEDSDGSIFSYVWTEGGNQIATGVNPTVTLTVSTHTIILTVTDSDGSTDTDTVVITVESPSNGLLSHWKLDDNLNNTIVVDSSVNNNNGTAQRNTSELSTTSKIGSVFTFNGSSDYIDCGNDTSLNITGSLSISAWVKFDTLLMNFQTIVAKRGAPPDKVSNYALRTGALRNRNQIDFYYHDGTNWHVYTTLNANLVAGQWYH